MIKGYEPIIGDFMEAEIVHENVLDLDSLTMRPEVGQLYYSYENLHCNLELI